MAKPKTGSVPNKALYSRVSYLYQAAAYMATQQQFSRSTGCRSTADAEHHSKQTFETTPEILSNPRVSPSQPASRRLVSELRTVSHKVLMRMSPVMKHSLCKNCDTMMIDGSTCKNVIENRSKGGKKPWADILVRRCNTCGLEKRLPLNSARQKRRRQRQPPEAAEVDNSLS
ncbi:hypothetical protein ONS96_008923 [Cadophora gregata f. sp. sojae]|nr:hypothetical protein ONS96_008923 [Cadophora gregata f. sp. sojae]